jgi:hypothetical protein
MKSIRILVPARSLTGAAVLSAATLPLATAADAIDRWRCDDDRPAAGPYGGTIIGGTRPSATRSWA